MRSCRVRRRRRRCIPSGERGYLDGREASCATEFVARFERLTSIRLEPAEDTFGTRLDEPDGDGLTYRLGVDGGVVGPDRLEPEECPCERDPQKAGTCSVDEFERRGDRWRGSPKGRWPGCGIPDAAAAAWQIDISHCKGREPAPGDAS